MSEDDKMAWILNALTEIETLDDRLKKYSRKIMKLDKENHKLKDEIQHLTAQLGMNEDDMQSSNASNDQVDVDVDVDMEELDPRTPSPRTPHLSPVKTEDVIRSVKRRLKMTPRGRTRTRRHANRGGGNKSRKKCM
jgi:chromosome segregation ATPase